MRAKIIDLAEAAIRAEMERFARHWLGVPAAEALRRIDAGWYHGTAFANELLALRGLLDR